MLINKVIILVTPSNLSKILNHGIIVSTQGFFCNFCDKSCSKVGNQAGLITPGRVDVGSDKDEGSILLGKH